MVIEHHLNLAYSIASVAHIETEETCKDEMSYYDDHNFTYIPLPFEQKYVNVETGDIQDMEQEQFIKEDAAVLSVLEYLTEFPFLLIPRKRTFSSQKLADSVHLFDSDELEANLKKRFAIQCHEQEHFLIITLADANRRGVKDALYPVIAEVEELMAKELRANYDTADQEELIPEVSPNTVGRWRQSKYEGLEMHISEFMTLSELVKIIGKSPSLREQFGFESRNQFKKASGGLVNLRNKIMHPARTLIHDREDLSKMIDRLERAHTFIETAGGTVHYANYGVPHFSRN